MKLSEFYVPLQVCDLEDSNNIEKGCYHVSIDYDFDVPSHQQLDDLTRIFDALHHEKSTTAIFTNKELFTPLYSYVKALQDVSSSSNEVTREARHKLCHEAGERLKKLVLVGRAFIKKKHDVGIENDDTLGLCLRSALKIYAFIVCHVLKSCAPEGNETDGCVAQSQRSGRKRRLRTDDSGFGVDSSGVDMDGRELALTALLDLCSPELFALWTAGVPDETLLGLCFKTCLHMISQKANINADAHSVCSAIALLVARICICAMTKSASSDVSRYVSPIVELSLKSDNAAMFLCRFVSDIELEDSTGELATRVLQVLFKFLSSEMLYEAGSDSAAAKNVAIFLSEVAKKSVSIIVRMAKHVMTMMQSESYDIRKAVVTCVAEMVVQRYSAHSCSADDDATRNQYLNELLFRVMDVNAFVRNHVIHTWERMIELRAVPKRYHISVTKALAERLEDRNYLVRDSSLIVLSGILRKSWFGHVLDSELIDKKLNEAVVESRAHFKSEEEFEHALNHARRTLRPPEQAIVGLLNDEEEDGNVSEVRGVDGPDVACTADASSGSAGAAAHAGTAQGNEVEQGQGSGANGEAAAQCGPHAGGEDHPDKYLAHLNKILFYENALLFIQLIDNALRHASTLLESRTERDVVEAIRFIVTCNEYRIARSEQVFLRVLVMVFECEIKIQLAVRDAFLDVVFISFLRLSNSAVTRAAASAQKLICMLRNVSEGEISAVNRIFDLLKYNSLSSRYLSSSLLEAVWAAAEGTLDASTTMGDRRTAMRVYSILTKHNWKDLRLRECSIIDFLSTDISKDNVLLSYVFSAVANKALDPQFQAIPCTVDPKCHPLLRFVVGHLLRPTTDVPSWMCMAESALQTIHCLCEIPIVMYSYILQCFEQRVLHSSDASSRAQLFFLSGNTALKQLIAIERAERQQVKALENSTALSEQENTHGVKNAETNAKETIDAMDKELGLGSHEYRRHVIQEMAQKRRRAVLEPGSLWSRYVRSILACCRKVDEPIDPDNRITSNVIPFERICAVMALCQFMIIQDTFCSEHLELLLGIVSSVRECWMIRTNIVIALGDLACVHPNILSPFLSQPTSGFFKLLTDEDRRVRAVTIQVCSHLVLGDMLRIRDHLHVIIRLIADSDVSIAQNAVVFVQNLASKEKEKTGNLIPPLITKLSSVMPSEKLQLAVRILLERVEGDKPIDSLIERLCQRFGPYSHRNRSKVRLAQNIAFCLSELNYSTERAVKRITSENCFQQYKHWLRNSQVYDCFRSIALRAKKSGRQVSERRDRSVIEEWEARMLVHSRSQASNDANGRATPA